MPPREDLVPTSRAWRRFDQSFNDGKVRIFNANLLMQMRVSKLRSTPGSTTFQNFGISAIFVIFFAILAFIR